MMMRKLAGLALAFLTFSPLAHAATPLPVIASFSILGDIVATVGGDRVQVTTLVSPNGDAHVYQPTPRDVRAVSQAKVVFYNGLGFEGWMTRLIQAAKFRGAQVTVSAGITPQVMDEDGKQINDPHAWQNPQNVRRYVSNIAAALEKADPAGAAEYRQRAQAFDQQLLELDQWAHRQIAQIPPEKRRVITSHDAFDYFAKHYTIEFLAPQGMNTESEASARDVARLIQQIKREHIHALFVENISNRKLLDQIAQETGVRVGPPLYSDALSAANGPANTYLRMFQYNVTTLVAGMKLN